MHQCSLEFSDMASPQKITKVFNDPVHGHIELPELCNKIIDTPEFQRLRYIKQLGGCYYVYPGASHNRFEHSIGVGYLAGKLAKKLQSRLRQQEELKVEIDDKDVLCVQIAGLCHDIGHGPFSHLFDRSFIPLVRHDPVAANWKHEVASVEMFRRIYDQLQGEFRNCHLDPNDITFIEELIQGREPTDEWKCIGRGQEKEFLYEIVANKRTGVDVDKWDYFARDCHHLGMKNNFDHNRLIKFARVLEAKVKDGSGKTTVRRIICTRDKEVDNLYDMFYIRTMLHRRAYQHKTTIIIEHMIAEALQLADASMKLSKSIGDMDAYLKLDDSIFRIILHSTDEKLKDAREILQRIERRQHYRLIGQTKPSNVNGAKELEDKLNDLMLVDNIQDLFKDIVILTSHFDYGMGDRDPVNQFYFYSKRNPDVPFKLTKDQVSKMLPKQFSEEIIRVYCKRDDAEDTVKAESYLQKACKALGLDSPTRGDDSNDG